MSEIIARNLVDDIIALICESGCREFTAVWISRKLKDLGYAEKSRQVWARIQTDRQRYTDPYFSRLLKKSPSKFNHYYLTNSGLARAEVLQQAGYGGEQVRVCIPEKWAGGDEQCSSVLIGADLNSPPIGAENWTRSVLVLYIAMKLKQADFTGQDIMKVTNQWGILYSGINVWAVIFGHYQANQNDSERFFVDAGKRLNEWNRSIKVWRVTEFGNKRYQDLCAELDQRAQVEAAPAALVEPPTTVMPEVTEDDKPGNVELPMAPVIPAGQSPTIDYAQWWAAKLTEIQERYQQDLSRLAHAFDQSQTACSVNFARCAEIRAQIQTEAKNTAEVELEEFFQVRLVQANREFETCYKAYQDAKQEMDGLLKAIEHAQASLQAISLVLNQVLLEFRGLVV